MLPGSPALTILTSGGWVRLAFDSPSSRRMPLTAPNLPAAAVAPSSATLPAAPEGVDWRGSRITDMSCMLTLPEPPLEAPPPEAPPALLEAPVAGAGLIAQDEQAVG